MNALAVSTIHDPPREAPVAAVADEPSRAARIAGRVLSGLAGSFLLLDTAMHLLRVPQAIEGTVALGYPASILLPIGVIQLVALALYAFPRTAVLGAILWTGYLGGAVASHVRLGDPVFTHVLAPVYVAAFLWLGLWLRDRRLRAVL